MDAEEDHCNENAGTETIPKSIDSGNSKYNMDLPSENSDTTYSLTSLHSMSNSTSNSQSPLTLANSESAQDSYQPLNGNQSLQNLLDGEILLEMPSLKKKANDVTETEGGFGCPQCALVFTYQNDLLTHLEVDCKQFYIYFVINEFLSK